MPIPLKPQRLTPYSTVMGIKKNKLWWLLLAIPFLIGCPFGEDRCPFNDWERITTIEDLFVISPIKDTFRIEEEIMIKIQINDTTNISGRQISLIEETNDLDPSVIIPQRLGFVNLFDNDLFFKRGFRLEDRNKFHLEYCDYDKLFSLKFKAKLSMSGNYFFSGRISIIFGEVKDCNWYRIDTNLKGYGNGNFLEFVVIE